MKKTKLITFEFDVRGHFRHQSTCASAKIGDFIWLVPEPDNDYDEYAIRIFNSNGQDLGYVPQEDNEEILDLLDSEMNEYCAKITNVEINEQHEYVPYVTVHIGIESDLPYRQDSKFKLRTLLEDGKVTYSVDGFESKDTESEDSKNLVIGIFFIVGLIAVAKLISLVF